MGTELRSMKYETSDLPMLDMLAAQAARLAWSRAPRRAGSRIAISNAMIATTTRSSINVKPCRGRDPRVGLDMCSLQTTGNIFRSTGCIVPAGPYGSLQRAGPRHGGREPWLDPTAATLLRLARAGR